MNDSETIELGRCITRFGHLGVIARIDCMTFWLWQCPDSIAKVVPPKRKTKTRRALEVSPTRLKLKLVNPRQNLSWGWQALN